MPLPPHHLKNLPDLHIILDFDGTLTHHDTLSTLSSLNPNPPKTPWSKIVDAYLQDYRRHVAAYHPPASQRTSVEQESAWLASLRRVEVRSLRRVEEAGVFERVTGGMVEEGAAGAVEREDVRLRKGWLDVLRLACGAGVRERDGEEGNVKLSILSVNWSTSFIRGVLRAAVEKEVGGEKERSGLEMGEEEVERVRVLVDGIAIYANELQGLDAVGGSSGRITTDAEDTGGIRTSADKVAVIRRLKQEIEQEMQNDRDGSKEEVGGKNVEYREEAAIVYVGDSTTDFDALIEADVGVCIRDEPMGRAQMELHEVLERLGVRVKHIEETGDSGKEEGGRYWRGVFWARDLCAVVEMLGQEI
ncbi:hypothetical protein K402DRAFT_395656 [Aulographum hederae CBS 113979]|uniref:HAD-like protein n=1 Tax=Aulographum hederae CBS 113979 TaxID=1176131 RepID=A0A6G1GV39_9PEZI|nr:hypothetical protein K402DRAFT_395656 [Aulographum hederae CBS 113979]